MNNTTEQEVTQEELTPEEAKASLGLSTRLSEQFLMQQMADEQALQSQTGEPEAPVEGQEAPGQEIAPETEKEPQEDIEALKNEIRDEVVGEIKSIVEKEMQGFRDSIKNALENEED